MGYEHELRKEALRLVKEKGLSIQRSLWAAYNDSHRRLENFLNFHKLGTADHAENDNRIQQLQSASQKLKKKVADVERAVRSRSLHGKGKNRSSQAQLALPGPSQLALPAPATGATTPGTTINSSQDP